MRGGDPDIGCGLDENALVSATTTEEDATVALLLDSGANPNE